MTSPATLTTLMREIHQLGRWASEHAEKSDSFVWGALGALNEADAALQRGGPSEARGKLSEAADYFNFSCGTSRGHGTYVEAVLQRIDALNTHLRRQATASNQPPPRMPRGLSEDARVLQRTTTHLPRVEQAYQQILGRYPALSWMSDREESKRFELIRTMGERAPHVQHRPLCVVEIGAGQLMQLALQAHELVRRGHRDIQLVAIDWQDFPPNTKDALNRFLADLANSTGAHIRANYYRRTNAYRADIAAGTACVPDMTTVVCADLGQTVPGDLEADKLELTYRDGTRVDLNLPFGRPVDAAQDFEAKYGTQQVSPERVAPLASFAQQAYAENNLLMEQAPSGERHERINPESWREPLANSVGALLAHGHMHPNRMGSLRSVMWRARPFVAAERLSDFNGACQHFSC